MRVCRDTGSWLGAHHARAYRMYSLLQSKLCDRMKGSFVGYRALFTKCMAFLKGRSSCGRCGRVKDWWVVHWWRVCFRCRLMTCHRLLHVCHTWQFSWQTSTVSIHSDLCLSTPISPHLIACCLVIDMWHEVWHVCNMRGGTRPLIHLAHTCVTCLLDSLGFKQRGLYQ